MVVLVLVAYVALLHGPTLGLRDLWWADEVRHAGVLAELRESGAWIALRLNGAPYPDKPPIYFWYLAGLQEITGSRQPWVTFLGLALTVLALLLATVRLGEVVLGDRRRAVIGALLLGATPFFIFVTHYARMDALFAALICLSWASFHRAFAAPVDRQALFVGYVFAGLATMVKGPFGFALPVAALLLQAWRLKRWDVLRDTANVGGLLFVLALVALWAGGIVMSAGGEQLSRLLETQLVDRSLADGGPLGHGRYLVTLPAVMVPWTLLIFAAPRAVYRILRERGAGDLSYLLLIAAGGLVILSVVGEKHEYYLLPLMVPVALLVGYVFAELERPAQRRVAYMVAAVLALLGALFVAAPEIVAWSEVRLRQFDVALPALGTPGVLALLGAVALVVLARMRSARWLLAGLAVFPGATAFAVILSVFPTINSAFSPAPLAALMRPYAEAGHVPAFRHGVGGVLAYHLGHRYEPLPRRGEMATWLDERPRVVFALHRRSWQRVDFPTDDFVVLGCHRLVNVTYVVLARPPLAEDAALGDSRSCL